MDRPPGERRLRHRLHPEPSEAGKHPTSAGTEERTLPWVGRGGGLDENWDVRGQEVEESAAAEIVEKTHGSNGTKRVGGFGGVLRRETL